MAHAQKEGYNDFDKNLDLSKGGIVYPFTGIRGDAKELWSRIHRGQIPNVELVQADTVSEQAALLSQADVVIVACGYHSKQIPLKDVTGTPITLAKSNTVRNQNDPSAFGMTHKLTQPEQVEVNYNC